MTLDRRGLIGGSLAAFGATLFGSPVLAAAPRSLSVLNLHTGEALKATYWDGGGYVPDALGALNKVLRDHRTGEVHTMAPNLFDLITALNQRLETNQTVQVISGYRSPQSNAAMHAKSSGVAAHSLHMEGEAMDIRIGGVALDHLRDAALALKIGGVGFYPSSNFVHVDIGRVRRWNGS
jgi:uncharacterized protein YcbK (DUF882 family)